MKQHYDIIAHKSGRYEITYTNKKEQRRRNMLAAGYIQNIGGQEVNLKSPKCYQHTGIDKYILWCALNAETETKNEFQVFCFQKCNLYYKLFNKSYDGVDNLASFSASNEMPFLVRVDELIRERLDGKINDCLNKFERQGYINRHVRYKLSDDSAVPELLVRQYEEAALTQLGYPNEHFAYSTKTHREKFLALRDKLFQDGQKVEMRIIRKEMHIEPLILPGDFNYPNLTPTDIENILTEFFNVLRAKLILAIKTNGNSEKYRVPALPSEYRKGFGGRQRRLIELVTQYCDYDANNVPSDVKNFDCFAISKQGEFIKDEDC